MFRFIDGVPVILTFDQVEAMYYQAFLRKFPGSAVSITQWRGSYEYQCIYPDIQMMMENGVIIGDSLDTVMGTIAAENQAIYRPAALHTRVSERFKQMGLEATIRAATIDTRGIVALCIDQDRTQAPRAMSIGIRQSNAAVCGFIAGEIGSLYPRGFRDINGIRTAIDSLNAGSNSADPVTYMEFSNAVSNGGVIELTFTGAVSGVFQFSPASQPSEPDYAWVCLDPALAAAFRANPGAQCQIVITGDTSGTVPVNNDDETIGNLIRDEMLPAGQFMEGDIIYDTAISNGQPITIRWTSPIDITASFRTTITRARNSPNSVDTPTEVVEKFNLAYARQSGIGIDITPDTYLTTVSLPWAASIVTECDPAGGTNWSNAIVPAAFNQRYNAVLDPSNVIIQ